MSETRCHSPGCSRIVPWETAYCSRCEDPRTDAQQLKAEYVHTAMGEVEFEKRLENMGGR